MNSFGTLNTMNLDSIMNKNDDRLKKLGMNGQ